MSRLPTLHHKQFEVKSKFLPGGKLTLIPFTVGLENLLLQVKEDTDEAEKAAAMRQVVEACIQTPNVDVSKVPLFAIEELFLRLRQNSVGELIDQHYQCTAIKAAGDDETICNTAIPIQIDLREFKLVEPEGHTNKIMISDPIGVQFAYPSFELFENAETDTQDEVQTIISCIEYIFDADNVYPARDHTHEELLEFWNQLTLKQKQEVFEKFFSTIPHLQYKKEFTCKGCGTVHTLEFNSIKDVFQ